MKGVMLEFLEESPFFENTVFIPCDCWTKFRCILEDQFSADINYMQMDCLDDTSYFNTRLRVGDYTYDCNQTIINQVIS